MSDTISEWKKGVQKGLDDAGLSEDNNVAHGMATAMRAGKPEADLSYDKGYETGKEVARRCKYHQR
ncbi:MAG: hypothetical protein ACKVJQ_03130 [Alphaproteobacteria bacterium]|jgi:hypothetical protein